MHSSSVPLAMSPTNRDPMDPLCHVQGNSGIDRLGGLSRLREEDDEILLEKGGLGRRQYADLTGKRLREDQEIVPGKCRVGRRSSADVAGKGGPVRAAPSEIPWRTSRRLQEATLRFIKEREGKQSQSEIQSPSPSQSQSRNVGSLRVRSPKRRLSPSESTEETKVKSVEDPESLEDCESTGQGDQSWLWSTQTPLAADASSSARRRKLEKQVQRKVQFSNDVSYHYYVHEELLNEKRSIDTAKGLDDTEKESRPNSSDGAPRVAFSRKVEMGIGSGVQSERPLSSFDLLCTHLRSRGWKCYRPRAPRSRFCIYHQPELNGK